MKQGREDKRGKSASAHRVKTGDTVVHGLTAMAIVARNTRNTDEWIIDSGTTHHISPNLMDFHEYHPLKESLQVESADSVSLATAAGSINLQLDCGILLRVEALYVPDFGASLLSECDTGTSGQRRSDGNIELVRYFDSHEGDGARAVSAGVQLLYRNNTPHDNPSKFAHR